MVGVGESCKDNPFGDLGPVDTGRGREGYRSVFVNWCMGNVVCAGREEVDEFLCRRSGLSLSVT